MCSKISASSIFSSPWKMHMMRPIEFVAVAQGNFQAACNAMMMVKSRGDDAGHGGTPARGGIRRIRHCTQSLAKLAFASSRYFEVHGDPRREHEGRSALRSLDVQSWNLHSRLMQCLHCLVRARARARGDGGASGGSMGIRQAGRGRWEGVGRNRGTWSGKEASHFGRAR